MAEVTSVSKERMLASEARTVVDGEVVGDNLILIRYDGGEIDAGNVRGPAGDDGDSGGGYELEQSFAVAATSWVFNHMQGTKALSVYTENASGREIEGQVVYNNENTITVNFFHAQTGLGRVFN